MRTGEGSIRPSTASRCRGSSGGQGGRRTDAGSSGERPISRAADAGRRGRARWRLPAVLAAFLLTTGCPVGRPPWVEPAVRILYRAEGPGRGGIRFLVAREGNEIALTRGPGAQSPAFDRHSGWVFYASQESGTWDLWRVRLSGEERAPLTSTTAADERWPVPAPDGGALFFTSDADGTDQIWRSDPDGGNAVAITRGPAPHRQAAADSSGARLAALEGEGAEARLVWIDVGSGAVTPVPGTADLPPLGGPAVRGDGSLLYACRGPGGADVCLLPPGEQARRIVEHAAEDREPAWSPDGRLFAFSSNREDGNFELYVARADGSTVRRLTRERGDDRQPAWVP